MFKVELSQIFFITLPRHQTGWLSPLTLLENQSLWKFKCSFITLLFAYSTVSLAKKAQRENVLVKNNPNY